MVKVFICLFYYYLPIGGVLMFLIRVKIILLLLFVRDLVNIDFQEESCSLINIVSWLWAMCAKNYYPTTILFRKGEK